MYNGGGGGRGLGWGTVATVEASAAAASKVPAAGGAGTTAGCPRCGWCTSRSVEAHMMVLGAAGRAWRGGLSSQACSTDLCWTNEYASIAGWGPNTVQ